jgi:hypothetical protein
MLATSTDAQVESTGLMSGSPDSGPLAGDTTAPAVPGGTWVTGSGCSGATAFGPAQSQCDDLGLTAGAEASLPFTAHIGRCFTHRVRGCARYV